MKEPFDYSIVPYTFGLCAAEECPRATTCLRHIALEYAPAERVFLSIMNPNRLKAMKGACDYYRSNEKVRYARGFMRTISALTVRVADTLSATYLQRYLQRYNCLSVSLLFRFCCRWQMFFYFSNFIVGKIRGNSGLRKRIF